MLGYFGVTIIHQTLTWTTGSLTCICDLFASARTQGDLGLLSRCIRRTFVESAENLTPEKAQDVVIKCASTGRKAEHVTVRHPLDEPRSIVLNFGFGLNFFFKLQTH